MKIDPYNILKDCNKCKICAHAVEALKEETLRKPIQKDNQNYFERREKIQKYIKMRPTTRNKKGEQYSG